MSTVEEDQNEPVAPPDAEPLSQAEVEAHALELREAKYGPKPKFTNWTGDPKWEFFDPCNLRGHDCPAGKYCDLVRVCTFKKRAKWPQE